MISYHDAAKVARDNETAAKHLGRPLVVGRDISAMDKPPEALLDCMRQALRKGPSHESPEDVRKRCGDKTQG